MRLHHVALIVSDLKRAAHMYGDLLGLELNERPDMGFEGLFYKLGSGQQLHLMRIDNPDANSQVPEHGGRYRHFALQVKDIHMIQSRLAANGVSITTSKSGRKAIFFYDDDGNAIELIEK